MQIGRGKGMVVSPNFEFLRKHDELLLRYCALAEKYVFDDPNSAMLKLRQFGELLALLTAAHIGFAVDKDDNFLGILNDLWDKRILSAEVSQLFHGLRKRGNAAAHGREQISQSEALHHLKMARTLGIWFHRSFGNDKNFKPGAFVPPPNPKDAEQDLIQELERMRNKIAEQKCRLEQIEQTADEEMRLRKQAEQEAKAVYEEFDSAMVLAEESEKLLNEERMRFQQQLTLLQAQTEQIAAGKREQILQQAQQAGQQLDLDEADTRKIIDAQLREAGWQVDSLKLTYASGTRAQKGVNLAIAEYPTASGPCDYVLFCGFTPVAVVEAKRKNKDIPGAIEQAKRYSRDFVFYGDEIPAVVNNDYKIPFLLASNGRPFLRQIKTKSGIWFLDAREATNHPRVLEGWYTPEGFSKLLQQNLQDAEQKLRQEPTEYLPLRDYQQQAVLAVEEALLKGQREVMLAMATGTGKTRTCIGLVYRLIKSKRFHRVLFLVDRSALGEQATNAFKDVRLENLQSFNDIYDIKEMGDLKPEPDTRLHVATVQGMMRRLLYPSDEDYPLPVDQYDCIVVDECHRGYNLDREMSEIELTFRSEQDYISKYRRVLDHFDAVKIGLTATPALHTSEIFAAPVYQYSYRQAVIDGWLIDHEPPLRIVTELGENGMTWKVGEQMAVYQTRHQQMQFYDVPDEVHIEIDEFNRRVITENFNRVICAELAQHIDPELPGKTLIFCATDSHADMVVDLLKQELAKLYGEIDDNAVVKITGSADRPLQLIRLYKNENLPTIAVTVDLLTTGVDVPRIVNLVFIRRVRSRILYEQMLGRATRLCPEIGKETFRIFDAVDMYSAMQDFSDMKPVVANPQITFTQLIKEMNQTENPEARQEIREQFIAKLRRKKRSIKEQNLEKFTAAAGLEPQQLIAKLRSWNHGQTIQWFEEHHLVTSILDRMTTGEGVSYIVSDHLDTLRRVERGYGTADKPEDYLDSFRRFVQENMNEIPALFLVTQKPRELTRKQLKELKLILDEAGYNENKLRIAWREMTNQDIAASIIGFIRAQALGSPLIPYQERVNNALSKVINSRNWTTPQRKWLERIGKQLRAETIVDRDALERGEFKAQGGFARLNKIFQGQLQQILSEINAELWEESA